MKITGIKQQVHQASRYSLYIDGKYRLSLSAGAVLDSHVVVGEELSDDRLRELEQQSADDKAYNNALRYVTIRQRSEWELATYLRRKHVDPDLTQDIIVRLRSLRLLDDAAFANAWIAHRRLLKPTSRRRLRQELQQKHVAGDIIDTALAEDTTDELTVLQELIARKRRIPRYRDNLKLLQYLSRQGYSYDMVKSALAIEEQD